MSSSPTRAAPSSSPTPSTEANQLPVNGVSRERHDAPFPTGGNGAYGASMRVDQRCASSAQDMDHHPTTGRGLGCVMAGLSSSIGIGA